MAIRTKTSKSYKNLLKVRKELNKIAVNSLEKDFHNEVLNLMEVGISPTAKAVWAEYSERYINQIRAGKYPNKTISPVNLKLTGKLYKSLKSSKNESKGTLSYVFTDPNAKKQDQGLMGVPKRQIFPEGKQNLHTSLTLVIARNLRKALATLARRASDR